MANVVETVEFDHEMMDVSSAHLDQRQAVVAWVDVEEKGLERLDHPIAELKAQQIAIERQQGIGMRDGKHGVAQAQGTRAKSGDGAARLERFGSGFSAVEGLEPRTNGILQHH